MKKLLKKWQKGVIPQLFSRDSQTSKTPISPYFQRVLNKPSNVFEDIPIILPLVQYMDHAIHLILGRVPSSIRPYRYPYHQKNEMEHMGEAMAGKSTIQEVVDHIENQQATLQIFKMLKNMMKRQVDQHHYQMSF